jgi:hypothetical protein
MVQGQGIRAKRIYGGADRGDKAGRPVTRSPNIRLHLTLTLFSTTLIILPMQCASLLQPSSVSTSRRRSSNEAMRIFS